MKAIVVRQPYAALIVAGIKTVETRPSPPNGPMRPAGVRGMPGLAIEPGERIAICAAKTSASHHHHPMAWQAAIRHIGVHVSAYPVTGAVVGTVVVAEALPVEAVGSLLPWVDREAETYRPAIHVAPEQSGPLRVARLTYFDGDDIFGHDISDQLPLGEYAPGRWGWLLADPQSCAPVPVTGRQGVFALPADVAEQVKA